MIQGFFLTVDMSGILRERRFTNACVFEVLTPNSLYRSRELFNRYLK